MVLLNKIREGQRRTREKLSNVIEWFNRIVLDTEFYDTRYGVKGAFVWRPYGMKVRRNVEGIIRRLLDESGHQEVLFPTFIPYEYFSKESQHIRGFEKEVFWVTRGLAEGESRLVLRPTSETAIMPMFKLWIKDHTDLPYKIYQIVSVFRAETKMTHPMIRLREVSMFKEAHTAHANREDAERQVKEAVEIYKKFFDALCIPYLISERPEWDKFAGAVYTIAFDTLLHDGKTLQIGTVHYLGTNFSKVFEVTYLTPGGSHEYVHTTSYGISERVIAAMLILHGDDRGLLIPPTVAPIHVVIVPIYYSEEEKRVVLKEAGEIKRELIENGLNAHLDDREDKTPGWKFNHWEMMGVPLRVELGARDIKEGVVTLARRDTFEKYAVRRSELVDAVRKLLDDIVENIRAEAWGFLKSHVHYAEEVDQARRLIDAGNIVVVPWNGRDECGLKIQELLGADALGIPVDDRADVGGQDLRDLACGDRASYWLRLSRRY